jgi:nucleotide-binding universal stress UspA family protein
VAPPLIAHATDLSGEDVAAFRHACALAAAGGARLVTIHGSAAAVDVARLPDAAPLAARWGRAIAHERLWHECCDDVADTVVDAIRRVGPELVVAGTHARHGIAALLAGSVAEAIARNARVPTLIVPNQGRGFVDPASGTLDLSRVLVAAGDQTDTAAGLAGARAFVRLAGSPLTEIQPIHVDEARVVEAIVVAARARQACLIVMATHGHDGVVDALLGSRTEHVVREAGCPVLSVLIEQGA